MALNPELIVFVRDALQRGIPRVEVSAALLRAGWPADQVQRALGTFAPVEFAVPVPSPVPSVSTREAFLYVLMFTTLVLSAYSLGDVVFDLIDRAFPDPAVRAYATRTLEAVRWSLSMLIVTFPVFLYSSWLVSRAVRADPTKRASKVRRQLTYVTLFIASCILIGDVTTLVYNVLGGELTIRFLLKVATAAAIAGTAFVYYLSELRADERQPET